MAQWNLWHGCRRISPGCAHCYVYRRDKSIGKDASQVYKTKSFYLPVLRDRTGAYKVPSGETMYTCFSSDFFLEEADPWREEAWRIIRERSDLFFFMVTKRIHRAEGCFPADWGSGWENVAINVTVENQAMAEFRMPFLVRLPIRHKGVACEPLLERVDLSRWLGCGIETVGAGGESGPDARICDYEWVLDLKRQCIDAGVYFSYHQTGARLRKDGRIYVIPRRLQHEQARKAGLDG